MNLREQYAALLKDLEALAKKARDGTLSEDEGTAFDTKVQEARELKAKVDELERRESAAGEMDAERRRMTEGRGSAARTAPGRDIRQESRSEAQAADAAEMRGIADRFLASEQWKEFRARGATGRMPGGVEVGSLWTRFAGGMQHRDGMGPGELRTLISPSALPAEFPAPSVVPGIFQPDIAERNVRSVLLNGQTNSDVIRYFRELAFTNNAAAVAAATATAGASGLKPESALTFEADTAPVETLAHWIPVTNQTLDDLPQLRAVIEGRLIDGLRLVEDDQLINGDGVAPNLEGLLTVTGTQALDAAHFTANPVQNAGADIEDFDRILRGRRMVRITGRARPNFVLLSPEDMERFLSTTDANNQYMVGGGPFGNPAFGTLWGMRAVETEALTEGTAIVGDGRMGAVWDRMAAQVMVGLIDDQFVRNMQTLLAEERLTVTWYRPAAFAIVELTSI